MEVKGDPAFFRRINYKAVLAGFAVALVVNAVLVAVLGGGPSVSVYFGITMVAMYCGGLTAGLIEPKYGVLNGPLIAVLFILVTALLTFNSELQKVKEVGPLGLGPMRVDRVFEADLPMLFFSSLGGLTAGWIDQRVRRRPAAKRGGDGPKR
jgi:hypothetical protein